MCINDPSYPGLFFLLEPVCLAVCSSVSVSPSLCVSVPVSLSFSVSLSLSLLHARSFTPLLFVLRTKIC